ncbi:hypothetical protein Bca101_092336 [Brassica carinata]
MVQQLNHPSKKVVPAPPFSYPRVLRRKKRIDTRQEQQTPPPNHRREIQAGAFHSPETIHASKLEPPKTRVALRRTHHQSPPMENLTQSDLPKYPSRTPDRHFKDNSVIYNPPNIKQRCEKRDG